MNNDKLILEKKKEIQVLKDKIKKVQKFSPDTNCRLELWGTTYNLNVVNDINDLDHIRAILYSLLAYKDYKYMGYLISTWISDVNTKADYVSIQAEKNRLTILESKLHDLLSNDAKVNIELKDLINQI